jgi:hypothetical protein
MKKSSLFVSGYKSSGERKQLSGSQGIKFNKTFSIFCLPKGSHHSRLELSNADDNQQRVEDNDEISGN